MRRLLAALLLSLTVASAAGAGDVSPRQRALLLLRVLVYDRALPRRAGGEVRVAVVYRPSADDAERAAVVAAIEELAASVKVAGLPVRGLALPYEGSGHLAAELARFRPVALYACRGLGESASEVAAEARRVGALAVTGDRRLVGEGGFALALVDRGDRAGLVLDPEAAAAAGVDFDSALLSVAEIVRRQPQPGPRP
ncbi:MAG: YfiR family protein [Anaeromyxobacteraceae bacterium]|nr:YfiR family protein [Anaeromyxobacteraceae bacterium]